MCREKTALGIEGAQGNAEMPATSRSGLHKLQPKGCVGPLPVLTRFNTFKHVFFFIVKWLGGKKKKTIL